MLQRPHPILHFALLAAVALRMIVGAPCCMDPASAAVQSLAASHHDHHAHHEDHVAGHSAPAPNGPEDHAGHEGHGGDNTANPCCSACGPTLPADPVQFAARSAPRAIPEPAPVRALATRPPFPAYDARGPPSLV